MADRAKEQQKTIIQAEAARLGFDFCGIARADFLAEEAPRLEEWLGRGYQGSMAWMAEHFDKRLDPRLLVPGTKSVIVLGLNYYPHEKLNPNGFLKIARYAYGKDYHRVIKKKLKQLIDSLREQIGDFEGRAFVDSAPVMERQWAQRAGLGWLGKNSLLLNKQMGSYFFLATLLVDLELPPDGPVADHCGSCTACLDACPTDAIVAEGVVDASRCISYLTIERREEIPHELQGKTEGWVFGCDICQEVCPWNRHSQPHTTPAFQPSDERKKLEDTDLIEMTEEVFHSVFASTAVRRSKYEGWIRNVKAAKT